MLCVGRALSEECRSIPLAGILRVELMHGHCAVQTAAFPKQNGSRPRTVIFTQGKDPTVVATLGKVGPIISAY